MATDPTSEQDSRATAGLLPALIVTIVVLGATALAVAWALNSGGTRSQRHTFVIPAGTSDRLAEGRPVAVMPAVVTLDVGDHLVIRNEDDRTVVVGPYTVRSGETLDQHYLRPQTLIGECGLSSTGRVRIVVT